MKKRDYMVTTYETVNEEIYDTLKEARARAKQLSKKHGNATINKWEAEDKNDDMEFVEGWEIKYENGVEVK